MGRGLIWDVKLPRPVLDCLGGLFGFDARKDHRVHRELPDRQASRRSGRLTGVRLVAPKIVGGFQRPVGGLLTHGADARSLSKRAEYRSEFVHGGGKLVPADAVRPGHSPGESQGTSTEQVQLSGVLALTHDQRRSSPPHGRAFNRAFTTCPGAGKFAQPVAHVP